MKHMRVVIVGGVAADSHEHGGLVGLGTALLILLRKPFDAMAVSTLMAASGCSRFSRHLLKAYFAFATHF